MSLSLSVFLPCYNEQDCLEEVVNDALAAAATVSDDFEVIVVDDGSTDRTGELADHLAEQHPAVRAVHNRPNQGYGGALKAGFAAADKEWVFYSDGDGQFDLAEIARLPAMLGSCDVVSGVRVDRQDPLRRRLAGWGWNRLIRLTLGLKLDDVDCGFKIYPRRLFDEIAERAPLRSRGAMIDAEVLAKARRLGYRIGQLPVRHLPRRSGQATGGNWRVIACGLAELARLFWHLRLGRWADRTTETPADGLPASGRQPTR